MNPHVQGVLNTINNWLLIRNQETREQWDDIFKMLQETDCQLKILQNYPLETKEKSRYSKINKNWENPSLTDLSYKKYWKESSNWKKRALGSVLNPHKEIGHNKGNYKGGYKSQYVDRSQILDQLPTAAYEIYEKEPCTVKKVSQCLFFLFSS